jgi:hypothetical protein
MLIATGLMLSLFFLTSLFVQHVLGMNALTTGLLFLPIALGAHLVGRVGGRPVAAADSWLTAVGSALLTQAPTVDNAVGGVLPGVGMAFSVHGSTGSAKHQVRATLVTPEDVARTSR